MIIDRDQVINIFFKKYKKNVDHWMWRIQLSVSAGASCAFQAQEGIHFL